MDIFYHSVYEVDLIGRDLSYDDAHECLVSVKGSKIPWMNQALPEPHKFFTEKFLIKIIN